MCDVPTTERSMVRAARLSVRLRQYAADEIRGARLALGLSQAFVGRACDLSQSQMSKIERAVLVTVSIDQLCRIGQVLGLDLSIKFYAGGSPLRDQAQVTLLARFRAELAPSLRCRTEVPVPIAGDPRAWDMWVLGAGDTVGVEAETKLRDSQALERRIALKARDSGITCVILLVSATHANRAALHAAEASMKEMFPVSGRAAMQALRELRHPGGSAIIVL